MTTAAPPVGGGGLMPPLAVTMGDPNGIGGEITMKAWQAKNTPPFFMIDDAARLQALAASLNWDIPMAEIASPAETAEVFSTALPILHQPLADHAAAVIGSIRQAVELVCSGQASAVVTNPIHKKSLYDAGFSFPGHTEFLADLAGIDTPPVMMLASPQLRVVPVTVHVSIAEALAQLTTGVIVTLSRITAQSLRQDFSLQNPRLAIAGLNPHAGEGGGMGEEEQTVIAPALKQLREEGINATGPHPPDTLFHAAARENYDAAICMYHDQALIPIKTLDFDGAVNITLGLPFVRTSPDHGTAFDIAGTGKASERSLLAALAMAADMASRRQAQSSQ